MKVEEVVLGDIVEITGGDKVPADMRLFQARGLKVRVHLCGLRFRTKKGHNIACELDQLWKNTCCRWTTRPLPVSRNRKRGHLTSLTTIR